MTGLGLALALGAVLARTPAAQTRAAPAPARAPASKPPASFATVSASAAAAREAGRLDEAIALYRQGIALRADWDEGRWYWDRRSTSASATAKRATPSRRSWPDSRRTPARSA